jgi:hypothetical protein
MYDTAEGREALPVEAAAEGSRLVSASVTSREVYDAL